ncbi:MAG TPA: DUF3048 domain-containing protein [Acidimicrobiales bacterium]
MRPRSRRLLAVVAIAAVAGAAGALVRAAVDEDDAAPDAGDGPGADAPTTWPLRGTPVDDGDPDPTRPALAVKVDATVGGRPQIGLGDADVVIEELVEGGLTRYLVVFHSHDPDEVGPVRSARSTDVELLAELGRPLFAWSGANPTFRALVEDADLVDVGFAAAPDAYRRDADRRAPYNLVAAPAALREAADDGDDDVGTTPPALFAYRHEDDSAGPVGAGVEPASGYRASTLGTTIEWTWDADAGGGSGAWRRTQDGSPHVDADGDPVTAANVVVRTTEYRDSGVRDSTGAVVPEAVTVGEGDAWLLTAGQAVRGRWVKPSADAPTTFADLDGTPFALTPGVTWVEVLPAGTGEVVRP